ncbi:hypothetical protein ABEB36_000803 [Hypothenemus hampei]|uniref:TMC domain-containing protein n=1 Tax=Hypothenemus hampei TaxID=57062 RepID=A0ABD1FG20_HYPHA
MLNLRNALTHIIIADTESVKDRKFVLPEDKYSATNFLTLWEFQGVVKYSPLFYGWYTNRDYNGSTNFASFKGNHHKGYWLPFAYFITGLVVYAYSFFAILRKMAENSRMSKLSEKDDECIFSWKLFTAWDYMIGNAETAHNRMASIVMGFKEALLEEAEKKRDWRIIGFRVLVNIIVLGLLSCSAFAVVIVVKRSTEAEAKSTLWRTNEVTVVINFITYVFPMLFEVLGYFEQYHPRMQLRTQLGRIMVLNLLNLYALIITLFFNIREMTTTLNAFKTNLTKLQSTDVVLYSLTSPTSDKFTNFSDCFCNESAISSKIYSLDMSSLAEDLSTISLPTITTIINNYFTSNFSFQSEQYENVTLTSYIDNITEYFQLNTSSNSIFNATDSLSFNDLTNFFNDYLAYLLLPFNISDDSTDNSTTMSFNESITTENSTFEYFKTTLLPLLNSTQVAEEYEERFDTELRTFFEEISSTISSLPNLLNSTDSSTEKTASSEHWSCQRYCKEFNGHILSTTPTNLDEIESKKGLSYEMKSKLRSLCWETMFGQELIRLTLMDLIVTGLVTLLIDFFRGIFVRVMNKCWCWDLEKKFPQYGEFKVAENILHLVNNQGMVWMGMFFSPGLVALNVIKLYILMYLRAWAVLTCNVPHEIIFRASRSNNFYYALLLLMLLLCVGPVGYTVVWIEPSWHCGPFSGSQRIFHIFTNSIKTNVPSKVYDVLDYIASPGVVIPLLLLLILIIYYLVSLTGALREANNDLKVQLRRERTVERRKMFQLADRRRRGGSGESTDQTPFSKWKKLLSNLPSNAHQESEDIVHSQHEEDEIEHAVENKGKISFTRLIKKTMGKASTSDEEDATDTEQHDSLPYENEHSKKTASDESSDFPMLQNIVSKWSLKRNKEMEVMVNNAKRQNLQEDPGMKQIDKARNQDRKEKTVKMKKESDLGKKIVETKKIGVFNDNESSTRSENIPVITISKTSSDDNMLKDTKLVSEPPSYHAFSEYVDEMNEPINFRPRVKCALKKQAIAIDEDIIIHFGDELQKRYAEKQAIFDLVSQKIVETGKIEDIETLSESSSKSSELKDDNSVDTILNCPCFADDDNVMSLENDQNVEENLEIQRPSVESSSRSQTESSTCYKE